LFPFIEHFDDILREREREKERRRQRWKCFASLLLHRSFWLHFDYILTTFWRNFESYNRGN
jgi:hypothetical protein